jgi:hypothetical protein
MIALRAGGGLYRDLLLIYCSDIDIRAQRSRLLNRRRLGSLAVAVFFWLTSSARPHADTARAAASANPAGGTSPAATAVGCESGDSRSLPAFRLGTAARPFGWSTAVGDFNTDGTPDLAIADRVSQPAGGHAYQIQFAVSGLAPKSVAFESEQDALSVRVSDVDHDNDLDVVVSSTLSHEIVGIWLNNGRGEFQATDARQFAPDIQVLQSVDTTDPSADLTSSGLLPRRAADGLPILVRAPFTFSPYTLCAVQLNRLQPALLSAGIPSRAPPSTSAPSLS